MFGLSDGVVSLSPPPGYAPCSFGYRVHDEADGTVTFAVHGRGLRRHAVSRLLQALGRAYPLPQSDDTLPHDSARIRCAARHRQELGAGGRRSKHTAEQHADDSGARYTYRLDHQPRAPQGGPIAGNPIREWRRRETPLDT